MNSTPRHRSHKGPLDHGPSNPLRPTTELEVLTHTKSGLHVIRQGYDDGQMYEFMIPNCLVVDVETSHFLIPPFKGRILRTCAEGDFNYVSVWVPEEEVLAYDMAYQEAAGLPQYDYSTPTADPEMLHDDSRLRVERIRCATGWIYEVTMPLGLPWPSFYMLPVMLPTRTAPIVSVESTGTHFVSKFWVADNAQPSDLALHQSPN
ncbi:hypothetical protein GCM10022419_015960 [Nonomuraea rosea]|uniref:Uncharacterized protein n=1 Tax=Nonomuraea rosea TaxID=638574 RepID=A0ABP6VK89_9ACTN